MQAYFSKGQKDGKVRCNLCHHRCLISTGKRGLCGVRENRDGTLQSLVYRRLISRHVDPIEKKPLFHVLPGSSSYSIATVGCNFACRFCQNADIAQMPKDRDGLIMGRETEPQDVVDDALATGCASIAYTYTEPTVYFETAYETATLAHGKGLLNVFVTNGYMTPEAVEKIGPVLSAANVDLKAFNEKFYKDLVGARLENVLETLKCLKAAGVFLEVTTLLIPGANDDPKELSSLARWLVENLGPETPWHVSRFHPMYRLQDRSSTPVSTLIMARETGLRAGLRHVYTGNIPGRGGEDTLCHQCHAVLIERVGYSIRKNRLQNGLCPECQTPAHGIWKAP